MVRSLGLTAYRGFTRRSERGSYDTDLTRPEGQLLWVHAASPDNLLALQDLALRLVQGRTGLNVILTLCDDMSTGTFNTGTFCAQPPIMTVPLPSEHPDATAAFIAHWTPDICIWSWGGLRPSLVNDALQSGCVMTLVDGDADGFDGPRDRWFPDVARALLTRFHSLTARSQPAARRLEQLGAAPERVTVSAPLLVGGQALPCNETDLSEMSAAIAGRPVWLACNLLPQEIETVLAAHRQTLRLSHRMLLVMHPYDPKDMTLCIDAAEQLGMRQQSWDDAGFPDENQQVLQVSDRADLGLFYRIAPVSFLGSSLAGDIGGCDPMEAAALGSAILYGPRVRRFMPSYTRLVAAGAGRIVNDAAALGTAVSRLIAPDQAAAMAHAGWDVVSEGAELTDRLVDQVLDLLDHKQRIPDAHT